MKSKLLFIACLFCGVANAQTKIQIKDFSTKYYAQVITKPDSSSYYIEVYEKGTNKRLIEAEAEQISDDLLENDQLVPNVKELPYGNQSVLIYEDFNFDGVKDFAIMNGFQSCYGGPSFDIYLGLNNGFTRSESFSELSNNYCGMFQVDTQRKRITTMTKSGCCWHQYSEYIVKNNEPVAVKVVEESAMGNNAPYFVEINTKVWIDGKEKEKTKLYMPYENVDTVFAFKLKKNKKTVCIFSQDSVLYYALIRPDASIEFSYPDSFHYTPAKKTLGFQNKDVYYEVYETGVKVKLADGTLVDLEGDPTTIKGAFNNTMVKKNHNIKLP